MYILRTRMIPGPNLITGANLAPGTNLIPATLSPGRILCQWISKYIESAWISK